MERIRLRVNVLTTALIALLIVVLTGCVNSRVIYTSRITHTQSSLRMVVTLPTNPKSQKDNVYCKRGVNFDGLTILHYIKMYDLRDTTMIHRTGQYCVDFDSG